MLEILPIFDFNSVDDPVKTEETIYKQLCAAQHTINTDYTYVAFPLAFCINRQGLSYTQHIIDKICNQHPDKKLFFVCQHILVNKLNFHGHLVFTPHATILDSFIPIPHYSCAYDLSKVKKWEDRKYTYSFVGSFTTHPVRRRIYDMLNHREDCLIVDTGGWHFEGGKEKQEYNKQRYIETLGDTKYSLCPRGTGPSTIRIWEAMAMGSCPVILSDFLRMPLEKQIDSDMWLKIPENCASIETGIDEYDNSAYFEYFSNENLCKAITSVLI